jgi:GAF domain
LEANFPNRSPQRVSAALAAAQAASVPARLEVSARGQSLAEMAQRDLDAALQLLADRARYITGASGAAIALRRDGRNDMLCRASAGSNAPELGALLSTEFGLSGESVRTRRLLRCDDAERDVRVNQEVCRQLGIASVLVMPVVNDDEVLGVFELFSGKSHAFGERDLSAVQRLSQMVETAVRLAHASTALPQLAEQLPAVSGPPGPPSADGDSKVLAGTLRNDPAGALAHRPATSEPSAAKTAIEDPKTPAAASPAAPPAGTDAPAPGSALPQGSQAGGSRSEPAAPVPAVGPKKPLLWSAALEADQEAAAESPEADQSRVPPVLRALRKCEACGFPVSAGRLLCVECEEKKWRGQLRIPPRNAPKADPVPGPSIAPAGAAGASTAAAPTLAKEPVATASISGVGSGPAATVSLPVGKNVEASSKSSGIDAASKLAGAEVAQKSPAANAPSSSPELVLSAAMASRQSWLAANKYVVAVLVVAAAVGLAFYFLR